MFKLEECLSISGVLLFFHFASEIRLISWYRVSDIDAFESRYVQEISVCNFQLLDKVENLPYFVIHDQN